MISLAKVTLCSLYTIYMYLTVSRSFKGKKSVVGGQDLIKKCKIKDFPLKPPPSDTHPLSDVSRKLNTLN